MSCEECSVNFSIFKRKKTCLICRRHHCSHCLPKEPNRASDHRHCKKCKQLSTGNLTRADIMKFRIKDLKSFLLGKKIALENITEKNDLVELILKFQNSAEYMLHEAQSRQRAQQIRSQLEEDGLLRNERRVSEDPSSHGGTTSSSQSGSVPTPTSTHNENPHTSSTQTNVPTTTASSDQRSETDSEREERLHQRQQDEMRTAEARLASNCQSEQPETRPSKERMSIKHVKQECDIQELSIKQLKEILATNFVDYKGCVEKSELIDRVKRLWNDVQRNQSQGDSLHSENEMCKICMDSVIDCVLLECGHMVTCTSCGKRLNECPICRQYVIRVVHTFKA